MIDLKWKIAIGVFVVIIVWRLIMLIIESVKMNNKKKVNGKK